jgi:succinylglutamate desuccinylase
LTIQSQLLTGGSFLELSLVANLATFESTSFKLHKRISVTLVSPGVIQFIVDESMSDFMVISSGIHGNETAPMELCEAWITDIFTGNLSLQQSCLFIFGNLPAIVNQTRFIDENLNRLFKPEDTTLLPVNEEQSRAKTLRQAVDDFFALARVGAKKYHYDLHTAIRPSHYEQFAVFPFLGDAKRQLTDLTLLYAMGITTVLLSDRPTGTFSYYSSVVHQAQAFTVELGKVMPFGENDLSKLTKVDGAFRQFLSQSQAFEEIVDEQGFNLLEVSQTVIKSQPDFKLHFANDLANFSQFKKGQLLASEGDETQYFALQDGEGIVFPNANVALGQRALLTVVKGRL